MVVNSEIRLRSKAMLRVIRNLVLHLALCFVTDEKVPFTCNFNAGCNTKYIIHHLMPTEYQQSL